MIVADANLIIHYVVDGDATQYAERCRARDPLWVAPSLWISEVTNVLARNLRSADPEQHMTLLEATLAVAWAQASVRIGDTELRTEDVLRLARDRKIGGYDAHYVLLAQQLDVRCVTADQQMLDRAGHVCISIEDFAAGR